VLAGGQGRRFGGKDKGLELWQGRTLVDHVIGRLGPQVATLAISCNRNRAAYANYATTVVSDTRSGFQGPLAGIEAYAPLLKQDYLAVAPCDMPLLPVDLVSRLRQDLLNADDTVGVVCAFDGSREQYLCALMRKAALPTLGPYLDSGARSVHGWFSSIGVGLVDCSDQAACFKNLNFEAKDPGAA
jgi:molybdenum cofactor guanylyltransferase